MFGFIGQHPKKAEILRALCILHTEHGEKYSSLAYLDEKFIKSRLYEQHPIKFANEKVEKVGLGHWPCIVGTTEDYEHVNDEDDRQVVLTKSWTPDKPIARLIVRQLDFPLHIVGSEDNNFIAFSYSLGHLAIAFGLSKCHFSREYGLKKTDAEFGVYWCGGIIKLGIREEVTPVKTKHIAHNIYRTA